MPPPEQVIPDKRRKAEERDAKRRLREPDPDEQDDGL